MRKCFPLFILVLLNFNSVFSQVTVTETKMTIPTYQIGEPEKAPFFYLPEAYQRAQLRIYPYPNIGRLSDKKTDKEYTALILENELVKVCVIPELGGRLYSALDKVNGYDFIYKNNVIKPSLIGMAGAWISGGVEWNIPHHHRVSTFMPVDYKIIENSDGSKTAWVGEYEKRSQTRWVVGLTLYPGRSYVEVTMRYMNVTPVVNSFLVWANAAVASNKDYQVIFPPDVERAVFHSKIDFTDYPVSHQIYQGVDFRNVDISWWKNTFSPTSFFAWDCQMDFTAGIDHGKKAGTAVIADHNIFPGKKFWNWGNNEVQRLWDQMLTDADGPYLELMTGMYSDNQPDYSWITPYGMKDGLMYYYPLRNISSVKDANKDVAFNYDLKDGKLKIQINATSRMEGCRLIVKLKNAEILNENILLDPSTVFNRDLNIPVNVKEGDLRFEILSPDNKKLISYSKPLQKNDPEPEKYINPVNPSEITSADVLYQSGLRLEQLGNPYFEPSDYYREALKRDPEHILANTRMGEYLLKKGLNSKAAEFFTKAVSTATKDYTAIRDAEPLYYLGLIRFYEEDYKQASELLHKSAWDEEWASASFYLLALIDCISKDYKGASEKAVLSLKYNQSNIEAMNLMALLTRHTGEVSSYPEKVLDSDPLNLTASYEKYLKDRKNGTAREDEIFSLFRDEPDNFLETAARYINAGIYADAEELLDLAVSAKLKRSSSNPLIFYYQGYCKSRLGDQAGADALFKKASSASVDYCFPYGHISEKVLRSAIESNSSDATAHYLLGNLIYDRDPENAKAEWEGSVALSPNPMAYRNIAFMQAHYLDMPGDAMLNLIRAIEMEPGNSEFILEYDSYAEYFGLRPEDRLSFLEKYLQATESYDKTQLKRVELLTATGQFDKAIELLNTQHFFIAERTSLNPHTAWTYAYLQRGIGFLGKNEPDKAITDFNEVFRFPRNLEISRDSKAVLANYWLGKAFQMKGSKKKSAEYFRILVESRDNFTAWGAEPTAFLPYYRALALKELGRTGESDDMFKSMITKGEEIENAKLHEALQDNSVKVRQSQKTGKAEGYLYLALGNAGLGNKDKSSGYLKKAKELRPGSLDVIFAEESVKLN